MIYLASPYTSPSQFVQDERYKRVLECTSYLMQYKKLIVFSPIVYGHHFAKRHNHSADNTDWRGLNIAMMNACSSLLVLNLDGWDVSNGVREEVSYMKHLEKSCLLINSIGAELLDL